MPLKRQFLYYQLLKHSGSYSHCESPLDEAVDQLCSAPYEGLHGVSLGVQLDALLRLSQAVGVLSTPEVPQLCLGVDYALERREDLAYTSALLGRALEAAGVAFAINNFTEKYRTYMESRLYRTQGLKQLLASQGQAVLHYTSSCILHFLDLFVQQTQELHARLLALAALKKAHPKIYQIFTKRRKVKDGRPQKRALQRSHTLCLPLDDQQLGVEAAATITVVKLVPSRRAFSVDVHAGLETAGLTASS